MSERITPERSAMLLADVSRFIHRKLPAWPEEFTPNELAAVIAKGWKGERKTDYRQWQARIKDAIDAGHLKAPTEERETTTPAQLVPTGNYGAFAGMRAREVYTRPAETTTRVLVFITRAAAAPWLARISFDFDAHEHVHAWMAAGGIDCGKGSNGRAKPKSKREKLNEMLSRIPGLNRSSMPGQKIDLHALALALHKDFQVSADTFDSYLEKSGDLPKLCTFVQGGQRDSGFYQEAGASMGLKESDYQKALRELEKAKAKRKGT